MNVSSSGYRKYIEALRVNIGTKKSVEYVFNLNSSMAHQAILPILMVEDPTLKIKDLRYYNRGKRQWCLYVRGKLYLRYDRHHGLSVYDAYEDYVKFIRDVVRHHLTHSVVVIHTYEGTLQNVYKVLGKSLRIIQADYREEDRKVVFDEISTEHLIRNQVGKDVRSYLKESP